MRRFHFSLEHILRIREHKEREWELKLASITGTCLTIENEINRLASERMANFRMEQPRRELDIYGMQMRENYMFRLDRRISELQRTLAEREEERKEIQKDYLKASRERKVLSKLKEKKADEYYKEQLKEEMKALDEIGNHQQFRKAQV
jgi:flagellar FliJ protein